MTVRDKESRLFRERARDSRRREREGVGDREMGKELTRKIE